MRYENASEVLPEELLKELQKYAAGKLLYVPSDNAKKWGEASGYRAKLRKRNLMICNKYAHGRTVSELADEYFLSLDSIKKIIYSRKNHNDLTYAPSVTSAVKYANAGMLEIWIQCYLLFTHNGCTDSIDLRIEGLSSFGVVKFPLRLIQTEGLNIDENRSAIHNLNEAALPPLMIEFEEGKFYSTLQQELFAALKQRKVNAYPTIILLKENKDYQIFKQHYGNVLFFVDS